MKFFKIIIAMIVVAVLVVPAMADNTIDHDNNQNQDNSVTNNYNNQDNSVVNNQHTDFNTDIFNTEINNLRNTFDMTYNNQQFTDITNNNQRTTIDTDVTNNNQQFTDITNNNQRTTIDTDVNSHNPVDNSVSQITGQTGTGNKQVVINNNGGTVGATDVNQDQSQKQSQSVYQSVTFVVPEDNPDYYGLNIGLTDSQVISLYNGQVLVAMNDNGREIVQKSGDVFRYTIKSSLPVLTYIVNANEANRAEFDVAVAPVYDPFMHKFDLGNLDTIFVSKYRSPNQQFDVTIPEDGRYALVIDTRVSQAIDGHSAKIVEDSLDVIYTIEKTKDGIPSPFFRPVVGVIDTYPILGNGMANTEF